VRKNIMKLEAKMLRKALLFKIISWVVLSPTFAMAADNLHVAEMPQLGVLYHKAAITFLNPNFHEEYSFTVERDGSATEVVTDHDYNKNTVTVDRDTVAIVHTHPMTCSAQPSPGDQDAANRAGADNYVLSRSALWVAHPFAKKFEKIGDVEFKDGKLVVRF